MGELHKFRHNESKSICSVFIPSNCKWSQLLGLVSLRLNIGTPIDHFELLLSTSPSNKRIIQDIASFRQCCTLYTQESDMVFIAHNESTSSGGISVSSSSSRLKTEQTRLTSKANMRSIKFQFDGSSFGIDLPDTSSWEEILDEIQKHIPHGSIVHNFILLDEDGDQISSIIDNSIKFWKFQGLHDDPGNYFKVNVLERPPKVNYSPESKHENQTSSKQNKGSTRKKNAPKVNEDRVTENKSSPPWAKNSVQSRKNSQNYDLDEFHQHCCDGDLNAAKELFQQFGQQILNQKDQNGNTGLHHACLHQNDSLIEWLVKSGTDIFSFNSEGNSPLHLLCQNNSLKILQICKKYCANFSVDVPNSQNDTTLLHLASQNGNEEMVTWILDQTPININRPNEKGFTPLHVASWKNYLTVGKLLAKSGASLNAKDSNGFTPLYLSCAFADLTYVQWLVESGASTKVVTLRGDTILHAACQCNSESIVEYLVNNGLNPGQPNFSGLTPLELVIRSEKTNLLPLLAPKIKMSSSIYTYFQACETGNETQVDLLLQSIQIETKDKNSHTALHLATIYGHLNLVRMLVEDHSADVMATNNEGLNVFHLASMYGHLDILQYFIDTTSVDFRVTTICGETCLHYACRAGHLDIVEFLESVNFSLNVSNLDFDNLLHISCYYGHDDIVNFLLGKNLSLVETNKLSQTPLHIACYENHETTVEILLEYLNSDEINCQDYQGMTPFLIACSVGNLSLASKLVEHGADITLCPFKVQAGNSPLHFAALVGALDLVKWLVTDLHCSFSERNSKNQTPYMIARSKDRTDVMIWFQENGFVDEESTSEVSTSPTPKVDLPIIHKAAISGNYLILKKCIQDGVDPNQRSSSGSTPLHFACQSGYFEIVKYLLANGANIKLQDSTGLTALQLASNGHHQNIVNYLNEFEKLHFPTKKSPSLFFSCLPVSLAQPNIPSPPTTLLSQRTTRKVPTTPQRSSLPQQSASNLTSSSNVDQSLEIQLCNACTQGNFDEARRLIENGVNVNAVCSPGDRTPLHCSCLSGNLELTQYLVTKHARLNAQNLGGLTPLHIACDRNYPDICLFLIRSGADIEIPNKSGNNCLHMICLHDLTQLFQEIISLPRTIVRTLDIDVKNGEGMTFMHIATMKNNIELVKTLCVYPSQVNCREGKLHETPLHIACKNGNYEIAECLIASNAFVNARDDNGMTPLLNSCSSGQMRIAKLLIKKGANIASECDEGFNPLHYACRYGDLPLVKWLVKNGLDPTMSNQNGVSPTQLVDSEKFSNLLEWLLAWTLGSKVGKSVEEVLEEMKGSK